MRAFVLFAACFIAVQGLWSVKINAKELKLKSENVDLKTYSATTLMRAGDATLALSSKYFVVQFKNKITTQDRKSLTLKGFEILEYLPDDAYIVKGDFQVAQRLQDFYPEVYAVTPYVSEWKLSADFQNLSILDNQNTQMLNIRLLPNADQQDVLNQLSRIQGVKVVVAHGRYLVVQALKIKALDISNIEGIEFIQLQPQLRTMDMEIDGNGGKDAPPPPPEDLGAPKTGYESGTKVMNFDQAWVRGLAGKGEVVSMADTGLDSGDTKNLHPDLQTVIGGEVVSPYGTDWSDPQGHGTHVTGSVIGRGTMSNGLIKGGAFDAQYFAQGMWVSMPPMFEGIMPADDLVAMFGSAYSHGARIHTNSWGSTKDFGAYDNFAASVDEAMWKYPDLLILFAAGNNGQDANADGVVDLGSVSSPGTAKNALTVGASENYMLAGGRQKECGQMKGGDKKWPVAPLSTDLLSDNTKGIACFSSRGPTTDNRIKPDIVSPGTNIVSLRSLNPKATRLWGIYDDYYSWAGGTSMATPLTAGAAAVARQYLENLGLQDPSAALVKALLIHTATDLYPGQFGFGPMQEIPTVRPNNQEGYGLTNMDAATNLKNTDIYDDQDGLATGEVKNIEYKVASNDSLRATLVYTDAPAAASAGKALVNDLDLIVKAPDGQIFTRNDHTNNTEMIEIPHVYEGIYHVSVVGNNVPQGKDGKQPYALIISHVKSVKK